MKKPSKAIVSFTGFRQDDSACTGGERLYLEVTRAFADGDCIVLTPRTWKTDVVALAQFLRRCGVDEVAMTSYSHGQAAATSLAKLSYDYGFRIPLWLACDPVYRPPFIPRNLLGQALSFRALFKHMDIVVPPRVRQVAWCRQTKDTPHGHDLVAENPAMTKIAAPLTLDQYKHADIDDSDEWFDLVSTNLAAWKDK